MSNGVSSSLVVAVGEILVDWISTTKGGGFLESSQFVKSLGGNAANVAIALARLGTPARILAKVGADVQGKYLTNVLADEGVDVSAVIVDPRYPTGYCYVFTTVDDDNTFLNWPPGNACLMLQSGDIQDQHFQGAALVHATGISLAHEPKRTTVLNGLKRAKELGLILSFDAGYPTGEGTNSLHAMNEIMQIADVIKVNLVELLFWSRHVGVSLTRSDHEYLRVYEEPPSSGREGIGLEEAPDLSDQRVEELGRRLFESFKPKIMLVTMAARGSYILTERHTSLVDAHPVDTVSPVGAGDAFIAGFLHAILAWRNKQQSTGNGEANAGGATGKSAGSVSKSSGADVSDIPANELLECHKIASAVGAIATTHVSAWEGLPVLADVERLIAANTRG